MKIWTEELYRAVQERIAHLAGCQEDTPEEAELIDLVLVIEAWEAQQDHAPSEQ